MNYINEVFDFTQNNETAKLFFKKFGGQISYCYEYGFVYVCRKRAYSLETSFKEDMAKSLEQKKNLLKKYPFVFKGESVFKILIIHIKHFFNLRKINEEDLCKYVFSQEELFGLITLALKKRHSLLVKFHLLQFFNLKGQLSITGDFVYSLLFIKRHITIYDIWNQLDSEATGKTKNEYIDSLNKLFVKYHYPRYCLSYFRSFFNPETKELIEYPVTKQERISWDNIDNS